jgi:hypothetical protein
MIKLVIHIIWISVAIWAAMPNANAYTSRHHPIKGYTVHYNFYTGKKH